MLYSALFIAAIFAFFLSFFLVDYLENRKIHSMLNPKNLPNGWVQVPNLLVWEKTDSLNLTYQVKFNGRHYIVSRMGDDVHLVDTESTLVALFEADQLIRF